MWQLVDIDNKAAAKLWFSDGRNISATRGGRSVSSRLIVENQGFIDFTNLYTAPDDTGLVDLNGKAVCYSGEQPVQIALDLPGDSSFSFSLNAFAPISGRLKPLPKVSAADAEYLDQMIKESYVPYPREPGSPSKTQDEIRALGLQFFPFSPHSFQLSMAVYDWTTPSFARMMILKMFEYTSMQVSPPLLFDVTQHLLSDDHMARPRTLHPDIGMPASYRQDKRCLGDLRIKVAPVHSR